MGDLNSFPIARSKKRRDLCDGASRSSSTLLTEIISLSVYKGALILKLNVQTYPCFVTFSS